MEAIFIITLKLLLGLMVLYFVSVFVDYDVKMTDEKDKRWDLKDIKNDPIATAKYASTLQKSKRLYYTVLIGIIIFVSFL